MNITALRVEYQKNTASSGNMHVRVMALHKRFEDTINETLKLEPDNFFNVQDLCHLLLFTQNLLYHCIKKDPQFKNIEDWEKHLITGTATIDAYIKMIADFDVHLNDV